MQIYKAYKAGKALAQIKKAIGSINHSWECCNSLSQYPQQYAGPALHGQNNGNQYYPNQNGNEQGQQSYGQQQQPYGQQPGYSQQQRAYGQRRTGRKYQQQQYGLKVSFPMLIGGG
ncbi:hypothetical protein EG329_008086 [Mollisiaceae sp. DMI_Dod_QoI]|nr:hypothetical protein EG329_008086 [Helotiales sp. DMI_Dod_QoI]